MNGTLNTSSCPTGSEPIRTEAACKTAALAMGRSYDSSSSSGKYPKGCYLRTGGNGRVSFNPHATGGVEAQSRPLCVTECPFEGSSTYRYDCRAAPCSCRKGLYKRAYSFSAVSSAQKECFTCVACAFSPRNKTNKLKDDSACAKSFGNFTSAQQCGEAVATNGTFFAVRYNSFDGSCSGCTSRFSQGQTTNTDPYEFYTCNLPQGYDVDTMTVLD
jgi:hypothetical protein